MAYRTGGGGVVQHQNLNINFPENNGGWKTNVTKPSKKGVFGGGRTPLGDVSNKFNPKQNSNLSIFSKKGSDGASKKALDTTTKKSDSGKVQTRGWKVLSDISNSVNQKLNEESKKKNSKAKLLDAEAIAEEGFLHNHEECIKAQTRTMDLDYFLELTGLAPYKVTSKHQENPKSIQLPESPRMELEEIAEKPFESWKEKHDYQLWKEEVDSPVSPPRLFLDHEFELKLLDSP